MAGCRDAQPRRCRDRLLVGMGVFALAARAVGDGRYVGFSKRIRGTRFSRLDDLVFTPTVVLLALGSIGALMS